MMPRAKPVPFAILLAAIWLLLTCGGLLALSHYSNIPGGLAAAPLQFPDNAPFRSEDDLLTMLVFMHPHCPCSHATLEELERLMSRTQDRVSATVIFWHPESMADNWHETRLWRRAASLSGVHICDDRGGRLTTQFGVVTSGQVLVYNSSGKLTFAGGITQARGHAGDNSGCRTILEQVNSTGTAHSASCAVYGCRLCTETGGR